MTVNVGVMQLPVTEDPDPVRTYLNGTHPSGGLWTALTRASNHDHSGGLNGVVLGATSIPDGSITTAKLDPAVLLPYALVDGSKPFTGVVTMNADALIRDTLRFGAKPAGVADATLARTAARVLESNSTLSLVQAAGKPSLLIPTAAAAGSVGVGVVPQAGATADLQQHPDWATVQIGRSMVLRADTGASSATGCWAANSYYAADAKGRALHTGSAMQHVLSDFSWAVYTAASVAANAEQAMVTRLQMNDQGSINLSPSTNNHGLYIVSSGSGSCIQAHPQAPGATAYYANGLADTTQIQMGAIRHFVTPGSGHNVWQRNNGVSWIDQWRSIYSVYGVHFNESPVPYGDGAVDLGSGAARWKVVYANQVSSYTGGTSLVIGTSGSLQISLAGYGHPLADATMYWGHPSYRWATIYVASAPVVGSTLDLKQDITPLDPAHCVEAVLGTDWVAYQVKPPAPYSPGPGEKPDYEDAARAEPKDAQDAAALAPVQEVAARHETRAERQAREAAEHAKLLIDTAPSRSQKGYVLQSPDHKVHELFGLPDRKSRSDGADLAVVACALQNALARIAALEAAN